MNTFYFRPELFPMHHCVITKILININIDTFKFITFFNIKTFSSYDNNLPTIILRRLLFLPELLIQWAHWILMFHKHNVPLSHQFYSCYNLTYLQVFWVFCIYNLYLVTTDLFLLYFLERFSWKFLTLPSGTFCINLRLCFKSAISFFKSSF